MLCHLPIPSCLKPEVHGIGAKPKGNLAHRTLTLTHDHARVRTREREKVILRGWYA